MIIDNLFLSFNDILTQMKRSQRNEKRKTKTKNKNNKTKKTKQKKHLGKESTKQPTTQLLQLYKFFDPH